MIIHHTTLQLLVLKAAQRLKDAGKDYDQLIALHEELERIAEQAEAKDEEIKKLLDWSELETCPGCFKKKPECECKPK